MNKYYGSIISDINNNLASDVSDAFEYVAIKAILKQVPCSGVTIEHLFNDCGCL